METFEIVAFTVLALSWAFILYCCKGDKIETGYMTTDARGKGKKVYRKPKDYQEQEQEPTQDWGLVYAVLSTLLIIAMIVLNS